MKSPFAEEQVERFVYPAPLTDPKADEEDLIDRDVLAEAGEPGEELPWIKFRVPRSKRDVDSISDATQSILVGAENGSGPHFEARVATGNRSVFALLCEAWSFTDDKPTATEFDRLDLWASRWVMAAMNVAMSKGSLAAQIAQKGDPQTNDNSADSGGKASSGKRSGTRKTSPRAADPA